MQQHLNDKIKGYIHTRREHPNRRRMVPTLAMALVTVSSIGLVTSSQATTTAKSRHVNKNVSPLQQGLNFYRGQTITLNVPTAAGAGFDIDTRYLLAGLDTYLHANIVVTDYAGGATIPGQNATASAAPNGLTIGLLETGTDVINQVLDLPGLNFNPEREVFLGGFPLTTGLLIEHVSDPYPNLLSMRSATTSNPVTICAITDNLTSTQIELVFKALGIHFRSITGYSNSASEETGWQRGDCQMVFVSDAGLAPFVKAGIARALATTNVEPSTFVYASQLAGVPLFSDLLKPTKNMTATERKAAKYALTALTVPTTAFAAPAATKSDRFLALRAAFKFVLHTSVVKNALSNRGEDAGYVGPTTEKAAYEQDVKTLKAAAEFAVG